MTTNITERTETPADPSLPTIASHEVSEVVIEGGPGRLSVDSLREVWAYREVLWSFAVRRIKVRYKQAIFGIGWAVLQPLISALMFAVFIGHIAKVGSEGVSYFVFALTGMTIWTYFAANFSVCVQSLVTEAFMLRKTYFPREVLPLSTLVSGVVDLTPALAITIVVAVATTHGPSFAWLALPVPLLLAALFMVGAGIGLSALNLYYRDVGYVIGFLLSLGLFASPVIYSLSRIPVAWRPWYAVFNPIATSIDDLRRILLHGVWPRWTTTGFAFLWAAALLLVGYAAFKRLERGFADRV